MRISITKDLRPLKEAAKERIDNAAGAMRRNFITDTTGQDMVYKVKEDEAVMVLTNPGVNPSLVPHLSREAARHNMSLVNKANQIIAVAGLWKTISAVIEDLRLTAKEEVEAANDPVDIAAAENIDWSPVEAYL